MFAERCPDVEASLSRSELAAHSTIKLGCRNRPKYEDLYMARHVVHCSPKKVTRHCRLCMNTMPRNSFWHSGLIVLWGKWSARMNAALRSSTKNNFFIFVSSPHRHVDQPTFVLHIHTLTAQKKHYAFAHTRLVALHLRHRAPSRGMHNHIPKIIEEFHSL